MGRPVQHVNNESRPEKQLRTSELEMGVKGGKFVFQEREKTQPPMDSAGFGSRSGSGINGSDGQNLSSGSSKLDRSEAARP